VSVVAGYGDQSKKKEQRHVEKAPPQPPSRTVLPDCACADEVRLVVEPGVGVAVLA